MKLYIKPWTINLDNAQVKSMSKKDFVAENATKHSHLGIDKALLEEKIGEAYDLAKGKDTTKKVATSSPKAKETEKAESKEE